MKVAINSEHEKTNEKAGGEPETKETADKVYDGSENLESDIENLDENHNIVGIEVTTSNVNTCNVSVGSDTPIPVFLHKGIQTDFTPEPAIEKDYVSDNDYDDEIFNENLFEKKISYRERVEESEKAYAEFCSFMQEQECR